MNQERKLANAFRTLEKWGCGLIGGGEPDCPVLHSEFRFPRKKYRGTTSEAKKRANSNYIRNSNNMSMAAWEIINRKQTHDF